MCHIFFIHSIKKWNFVSPVLGTTIPSWFFYNPGQGFLSLVKSWQALPAFAAAPLAHVAFPISDHCGVWLSSQFIEQSRYGEPGLEHTETKEQL